MYEAEINRCNLFSCCSVQSKEPRQDVYKQGYVESLVSPPGTHPSPSASETTSPKKHYPLRKCSLIQEESIDEDEEMDMDVEESKSVRSLESIEDRPKRQTDTLFSSDDYPARRPLHTVASSPQLLNQINEERESDEDDDIVPIKLSASALRSRQNLGSPEMIRKYEHKKRRGAGSRGTSCSSSDASDTDDQEGRSRKEKLKHKMVHRRDSSEHSSDTDAPGGQGGNLGGGSRMGSAGGGSGGGGSAGHSSQGKDSGKGSSKDRDSSGGSSQGQKRNCSSLPSMSSFSNISTNPQIAEGLSKMKTNQQPSCNNSVASTLSNLSLASVYSNGVKYMVDRPEKDAEESGTRLPCVRTHLIEVKSKEVYYEQGDRSKNPGSNKEDIISVCSADCSLNQRKNRKPSPKVKTDINSNGLKADLFKSSPSNQLTTVKVETKCCSLV